ncbi:Uncharacterised protein [Actinomyces bovis]|uniref:PKD domain-containing protein n=1 Tax=Actinomyces bovis TaxID=1658 RepID=A0ABY1VS57_9ACTO|nr:zinc transporter [Actinomyces bovis]SPT53863.1 Uncharacterised protein [Actinomyces bovis]VEG53272.1 Uncharacterised protein [Actinomyces israelii]
MKVKGLLRHMSAAVLVTNALTPMTGFDFDANSGSNTVQVIGTSNEIVSSGTPAASALTGYPGMNTGEYVQGADNPSTSNQRTQFCAAVDDPEIYFEVWRSCVQQPAEPAVPDVAAPARSEGGRVIRVSRSQVSRLLVDGSGITRQPPSLNTRRDMPMIVYTNPEPRVLSTEVLGVTVTITATPKSYAWSWGDGTITRTTDPGHPYPEHTVYHYYQAPAQGLQVTLTTSWSATYTTPDGVTRPVAGTVTTTNTTTPFNVKEYTAVLTDQAEEAQGH